jgi:arylformamidase
MKVLDISMAIHEGMMTYRGDPAKRPRIVRVRRLEDGGVNESEISMNLHAGTHLDAPLHMLDGGAAIDGIDPARLVTRCRVVDLTDVRGPVRRRDLEPLRLAAGTFVLLKTINSASDVDSDATVTLAADGAEYLVERGVAGVGIDALGIERGQPGHETHRVLFGAGILVLEGLRLADAAAGEYTLIALPLRIRGVDGSPARALLIED